MNNLDMILTAIAREHLGIPTLEVRNSDSLDFHEVSVWGVKAALTAAYRTGKKNSETGRRLRTDSASLTLSVRPPPYYRSQCLREPTAAAWLGVG